VRRLRALEGPLAFNAWLHTAPFGGDGHWHFEIVPRLTVFAGVELGAGIYVNPLAPEEAAQTLRQARP
jgi:UDPglucose--hexose-1-phosphate uridylyltransferase